MKSEGKGEPKRNPSPWIRPMNDSAEKLAESMIPDPDMDATELLDKGFAEREK